jgi:hypothetical protein
VPEGFKVERTVASKSVLGRGMRPVADPTSYLLTFSIVPRSPSAPDVSFSESEPFGTSKLLRAPSLPASSGIFGPYRS